MSFFTPRLKPPHSSEFKLHDPLFWLHDLPQILSGSRPRIATQSTFEIDRPYQPARPSSPLDTVPPDSPPENSHAQQHVEEPNRQHFQTERNPIVNPAHTSGTSNKRPRGAVRDNDDIQKSNQTLLLEGNFRLVTEADGDVGRIFSQLNFSGCSHIAITAIDNSLSSPFNIFGRATAEFDHLVGFVLGIAMDHRDISEFVALILPPDHCVQFIYKLLGSQLPVCMWNVMEVLRQCEKQTKYKNNVDWSLRHCICLSAAVWLIDPSADCTDFESCIAFIKSSTQIQPPVIPSETLAVPSDKHSRVQFLQSCLRCCVQLSKHVMLELERLGMVLVFRSIEMPLIGITLAMERFGIGFVPSTLEDQRRALKARSLELINEANAAAGTSFLLSSPQQLAEVLFVTLKLPAVNQRVEDRIDSRNKKHEIKHGKYTVGEEVLMSLLDKHPLPRIAMEYRHVAKMLNTFIDPLGEKTKGSGSRIHCKFSLVSTSTGRLSAREPNLQQIPNSGGSRNSAIKFASIEGLNVRNSFVSSPGMSFVTVDFQQCELRVLAHCCGDSNLILLFKNKSDIYLDIASTVLSKDQSLVTPNERTQFKTVVLGIIYGIGSKALSSKLSLSVTDCQQMIQKFLAKFPKIQEFMSKTISQAQSRGFVHTIHGRRRLLEDINSSDPAKRSYAERQSVNTIIQGSAADIAKATMIRVNTFLRERKLFPEKSRLILQLHDELVFEVSDSILTEVAYQIEAEIAEVCCDLVRVDMPVKIQTGKRWGDLKAVPPAPKAR